MTEPPTEAYLHARLRALLVELLAARPPALRHGVAVGALAARLPELPYAQAKAAIRALAEGTPGLRYIESMG